MKTSQFGAFLVSYAHQLERFERFAEAKAVVAFGAFFQDQPEKATVSAIVKAFAKLQPQALMNEGPTVSAFINAVKFLHKDFSRYIMTAALKDFGDVEKAVSKFSSCSVESLVFSYKVYLEGLTVSKSKIVRQEVVDDYVLRLENALGKDADFSKILSDLQSKNKVSSLELQKIATTFYGKSVKGSSEALRKIWVRQNNLVDQRSRNIATGGRTAA